MTITTPEQMREAAARAAESPETPIFSSNWSTAQDAAAISAGMSIAAAIRAIPIDTQPVAVTVKPLKGVDQQVMAAAALLSEKAKENPEWAFIDYEANAMSFGRWAKCGPNPAPYIRADIVLSALTIQPADPLSDPRVVALVEAAVVLIAQHDMKKPMRQADFHGNMCQCRRCCMDVLRAALRAIGGEA